MPDETLDHRIAPMGCRDPKLWLAAVELLAAHAEDRCIACSQDAPCTVISSARDAQRRAMESYSQRWLSGDDDYAPSRVSARVVGRARVRQRESWARRALGWVRG